MPEQSHKKKTVLVTGFGPFGDHKVNASWVAVQNLNEIGIAEDIDLVIKEIPVEYCSVQDLLPKLWETYNPHLVIHVGVSGIASELTLEQQAHNDGYDKGDVLGKCPDQNCCVDGADNCIASELDMQCVCHDINNSGIDVKAVVSLDPGRYLCDFSYYRSLHIDKSRVAFIHVPPLNKPYSQEQLAEGLRQAILSMLKQLH